MPLINRHVLRRAVNLGRGGLEQPRHLVIEAGLTDVQGPRYINVDVTGWGSIRIRDGDKRCEMENDIDVFRDFPADSEVANVPGDDLQRRCLTNGFQPTPVIERIVLREPAPRTPTSQQQFHQMRADEPIRTRYQHTPPFDVQ